MLVRDERIKKVSTFNEACIKAGFMQLAPHVFELCGPFSKTLTLLTLIHGNEIGGIETFLKLLEDIRSEKLILKANLRLVLGNVEAYYENKRYLETDMNRSFGLDEHVTREELRARELEKFLKDSTALVDIHQTIGPSVPFFIFEFDKTSYHFARSLDQALPVVMNAKERSFKGKTSTQYMISKGGMGVALETGQMGVRPSQISLGLELARKACVTSFKDELPASPFLNTYTFHQIIDNPNADLELVRKFNNFDPVKAGEILAANSQREVRSEVDGFILFPKYGAYAKATRELALILAPAT